MSTLSLLCMSFVLTRVDNCSSSCGLSDTSLNNLIESEKIKNVIRKWWWSYVDVIHGDITKQQFNNNLKLLWDNDCVLEEPGVFRYNNRNEMLNGKMNDENNIELPSVVNGLLNFDINKLILGDIYVEFIADNAAKVRAFKTLLHHNKRFINYNYDTWIFQKNQSNSWKIKRLTIELDTFDNNAHNTYSYH
eukprot:308292_1